MATWISPKEGAARFRTLAELRRREIINAARRATHAWRQKAFALFSQRGLGRVFGGQAVLGKYGKRAGTTSQARVIIKRERVTVRGDLVQTGLRLRGFAALVESGGRTKAHTIAPKNASILVWRSLRGPAFARKVNHPGSRMPRVPFAELAGRQSQADFAREMEVANRRSVELAKLAG